MVYNGLVPISPNTTPTAPITSVRSAVWVLLPESLALSPVAASTRSLGCSLGACSFIAGRCSAAQRRAQRLADDGFGIIAFARGFFRQPRGFRRLVAELLQCGDRFLLRRRLAPRTRLRLQRHRIHAITQFDHDPLCGFLADARDARQRGDVRVVHQPREFVGADTRQNRQRNARTDAGDFLQIAEQRTLLFAQETEQGGGVFPDRVMGQQRHFASGFRQVVQGGHRHFQLVADAGDVQHDPGRLLGNERSTQSADHRRLLHAAAGIPIRCAPSRACACAIATASASAASACNRSRNPSSTPTMCCTCAFSARPPPTTACLIAVGAYSRTGSARLTAAQIAAPRACPSFSAESAFLAMNTRSIAASAGWYWSMIASRPS